MKALEDVNARIKKVCLECNRNPEEITLVGIAKTVSVEKINDLIRAGLEHVGESKIQEAENKFPELKPCTKHFVGHLQSNKVKKAVELFDFIQSIDSLKLARKVSEECESQGKVMYVLIQVLTDESKEYGISREEVHNLLREISLFPGINVLGLMNLGPWYAEDQMAAVENFRFMKDLFIEMQEKDIPYADMKYLSMGTSDDFEVAIKEGSNMLRVGRALFGERK